MFHRWMLWFMENINANVYWVSWCRNLECSWEGPSIPSTNVVGVEQPKPKDAWNEDDKNKV